MSSLLCRDRDRLGSQGLFFQVSLFLLIDPLQFLELCGERFVVGIRLETRFAHVNGGGEVVLVFQSLRPSEEELDGRVWFQLGRVWLRFLELGHVLETGLAVGGGLVILSEFQVAGCSVGVVDGVW